MSCVNTLLMARMDIEISPKPFNVGGINIGQSGFTGLVVVCVLVVALVLLNVLGIRRFRDKPGKLQTLIETLVDWLHNFCTEKVGHLADQIAPFVLTFMCYVIFTTLVELIGLPAATMDLSCTLALGLMSFVLTNVVAMRELGLRNRIKHLATPNAAVLPMRVLTDVLAPFSMALRLFANVLAGAIIMELIYMAIPYVVPSIVASFFSLAHPLIQTYVFGLLSLNYLSEALE